MDFINHVTFCEEFLKDINSSKHFLQVWLEFGDITPRIPFFFQTVQNTTARNIHTGVSNPNAAVSNNITKMELNVF